MIGQLEHKFFGDVESFAQNSKGKERFDAGGICLDVIDDGNLDAGSETEDTRTFLGGAVSPEKVEKGKCICNLYKC